MLLLLPRRYSTNKTSWRVSFEFTFLFAAGESPESALNTLQARMSCRLDDYKEVEWCDGVCDLFLISWKIFNNSFALKFIQRQHLKMFVRRHVVHIYCSVFMLVCLRERSSSIIRRRGGGETGQDEDLYPECHIKLSAQFKGSQGRKATKEYPLLILEYVTQGLVGGFFLLR